MTQTGWIFSLTQFYTSLGFALFFLALELGLSWILLIYRIRAKHSVAALYAYRFWVRVFALCCVLAFAASIPVILNLGVIWPRFMNRMGELAGPLIGLAILTSFIFKSCFLGVMLYGKRTLSDFAHTMVVFMVALGSSLSSYWIMAFMAWQQKPTGAEFREGHYIVTDWLAVLGGNSPLFFGLFLLTGLLLAIALMFAVIAKQTQIRPSDQGDNSIYRFAVVALVFCLLLQAALSYLIGMDLLNYQPGRLAAVIPKWLANTDSLNISLLAGLNPDLGQNNWQFMGLSGIQQLIQGLFNTQIHNIDAIGLDKLSGLHPPVWFTYYSARLTVLCVLLGLLLAVFIFYSARKNAFDLDFITVGKRFVLRLTAIIIVLIQLIGWAHLLLGILPFATYETISLRELSAIINQDLQVGFIFLQLLLYVLFLAGLRYLIVHNIRYGVIPVSRHRGRA